MKDLYLKPVVEMTEFDLKDVIVTSPNDGDPVNANETQGEKTWSGRA